MARSGSINLVPRSFCLAQRDLNDKRKEPQDIVVVLAKCELTTVWSDFLKYP